MSLQKMRTHQPVTAALVSRIAWTAGFTVGPVLLIASVARGYRPVLGVLALMCAVCMAVGVVADLIKRRNNEEEGAQ